MLNRFVSRFNKFAEARVLLLQLNNKECNKRKPSHITNMASSAKPRPVVKNNWSNDFQNVPNVLIATNDGEQFLSLSGMLRNVLDPGKVYKSYLKLFNAYSHLCTNVLSMSDPT